MKSYKTWMRSYKTCRDNMSKKMHINNKRSSTKITKDR